jgi:hypothetical protein
MALIVSRDDGIEDNACVIPSRLTPRSTGQPAR